MTTALETTEAAKPHPKTTYYNAFPERPRANCSLCHVFWVVANDFRILSRNERRNVIYPAKKAGLIADAPADKLGVQVNLKGDTSRCDFVLTAKGQDYYKRRVLPVLPEDFTSPHHLPKRRRSTEGLSTADIKAGKNRSDAFDAMDEAEGEGEFEDEDDTVNSDSTAEDHPLAAPVVAPPPERDTFGE